MSTNRHDLHAVFREVRRDWDLSTSGLREAWDSGDLLPFHGWGKRPGSEPQELAAVAVDEPTDQRRSP